MAASASDRISVALLRPLAALLDRLDADGAAFLASLGIDVATTPETYVAGHRVDALLAAIADRRRDPAFALALATESMVRPLGLFGHMVWLSGTLRDALTRAVRFYGMVTRRTRLTLDEPPGGAHATVRQHPTGTAPRGRILTELPFASLALRARAATGGRFALRAVRFAHAGEAPPLPAYADVFGTRVEFGAPIDELVFDAAALELALATADPITSAALETKVAELAGTEDDRSPFVDRVRRAAADDLADGVSLAGVARRLGMSARTLRRHLEREGCSLRAVIDDVRRERGTALLAAGTPVKEIASSLGFSEPSAFSRAYKRWTGKSPRPR